MSEGSARLPLLYEFEGVCHGGDEVATPEHRFRYCNRGNAKGQCHSFPAALATSAIRFNVTGKTAQELTVLVMEEQDHWPSTWAQFKFVIAEQRLEPEIEEVCRRAQVFQFCRSYLDKF
jgi:hypothetical protein